MRLKDLFPFRAGTTDDQDKKVSKTRWGKTPGADEETRFLYGPQERRRELARAIKIFFEFMRGFRTLHFVGPCVTVFGSARLRGDHPAHPFAPPRAPRSPARRASAPTTRTTAWRPTSAGGLRAQDLPS